jgi:hypothetical protein
MFDAQNARCLIRTKVGSRNLSYGVRRSVNGYVVKLVSEAGVDAMAVV